MTQEAPVRERADYGFDASSQYHYVCRDCDHEGVTAWRLQAADRVSVHEQRTGHTATFGRIDR